jgi:hypothetical protein
MLSSQCAALNGPTLLRMIALYNVPAHGDVDGAPGPRSSEGGEWGAKCDPADGDGTPVRLNKSLPEDLGGDGRMTGEVRGGPRSRREARCVWG